MELENEETECVNENENKENKNVDEFHEFILQQKPANTKVKTQGDMKAWKRFCLQENENRELSHIPEEELNLLLCKCCKTLKKLDGTVYESSSLTSFQRSLRRSLNERGSNVNIIEGDNFKLSRQVLSAKGSRPQAARELTEAEEDKLFDCGEFGTSNPTVLQRALWWFDRAREESRRLKWGDVTLEKDSDTENEILVWRYERGSKTRQG